MGLTTEGSLIGYFLRAVLQHCDNLVRQEQSWQIIPIPYFLRGLEGNYSTFVN